MFTPRNGRDARRRGEAKKQATCGHCNRICASAVGYQCLACFACFTCSRTLWETRQTCLGCEFSQAAPPTFSALINDRVGTFVEFDATDAERTEWTARNADETALRRVEEAVRSTDEDSIPSERAEAGPSSSSTSKTLRVPANLPPKKAQQSLFRAFERQALLPTPSFPGPPYPTMPGVTDPKKPNVHPAGWRKKVEMFQLYQKELEEVRSLRRQAVQEREGRRPDEAGERSGSGGGEGERERKRPRREEVEEGEDEEVKFEEKGKGIVKKEESDPTD